MRKNKVKAGFRLDPNAFDLLKQLSANCGISQSDLIEMAVVSLSYAVEMKMIGETDEKAMRTFKNNFDSCVTHRLRKG